MIRRASSSVRARFDASPDAWVAVLLFVGSAIFYTLLGNPDQENVHDDLARAFLRGELWVPLDSHWELVRIDDQRAWSPFPPIPALTFIPLVLAGIDIPIANLGALVGAGGVSLGYAVMRRLDVPLRTATWAMIGIGGATYGWIASTSSLWFYAQLLGVVFSLAALGLAIGRRWPFAAGVLLGLAAGSRLPAGLMLPLLAWFYWERPRRLLELGLGLAMIAIPIAAYNVVRFGSPFEFGYGLIESFAHPGEPVTAEPYFREGVLDIGYIPRSIGAMLLQGYEIRLDFPWFWYPVSGVGIPLSAPILLLALRARWSSLMAVAWIAFIGVMLPNWAHGSWGFWQFGYRFVVDAMAPTLVMIALAYRHRQPDWLLRATAVFGVAATMYAFAAEFWWNARIISPAISP
ncbi:MAG: hypothetical protein ACT4OQ_10555 [Chloroflexota bacterium]